MTEKQIKQITLTDEELSKVITVAIFGYGTAFLKGNFSEEELKKLYDSTLESIQEGGFAEEFIQAYDKHLFPTLKAEIKKVVVEQEEDKLRYT